MNESFEKKITDEISKLRQKLAEQRNKMSRIHSFKGQHQFTPSSAPSSHTVNVDIEAMKQEIENLKSLLDHKDQELRSYIEREYHHSQQLEQNIDNEEQNLYWKQFYENELRQWKEKLKAHTDKVIETFQHSLNELSGRSQQVSKENSDLRLKQQKLEYREKELEHEANKANKKIQEDEGELKKLRDQMNQITSLLETETQRFKEDLGNIMKLKNKAEEDLLSTKQQFKFFRNEMNDLIAKHNEEKTTLEHHKRRLERALIELNTRLQEEKQQSSPPTSTKDQRKRITDLENALLLLQKENQDLKRKLQATSMNSNHQNSTLSHTPIHHDHDTSSSHEDEYEDLNGSFNDQNGSQETLTDVHEGDEISKELAAVVTNNPEINSYIPRDAMRLEKGVYRFGHKKIKLEVINREVVGK
jgi:chromosome segregation ATPase